MSFFLSGFIWSLILMGVIVRVVWVFNEFGFFIEFYEKGRKIVVVILFIVYYGVMGKYFFGIWNEGSEEDLSNWKIVIVILKW